jgi:hypothetical protein
MPKKTEKDTCDVVDCDGEAVQQFVLDGGQGPTVTRCQAHSIPPVEQMPNWTVNYPKPAKPEK